MFGNLKHTGDMEQVSLPSLRQCTPALGFFFQKVTDIQKASVKGTLSLLSFFGDLPVPPCISHEPGQAWSQGLCLTHYHVPNTCHIVGAQHACSINGC